MKDENGNEIVETTATEVADGEVVNTDTETTEKKEAAPDTEDGKEKEGEEKKPAETKPKPDDERERNKKFAKERVERKERERRIELENAELKGRLKAIEEYGLKKSEAPKPEDAVKHFSEQFDQQVPKPKAGDYETVAEHTEVLADWKWQKNEFVKSKVAEAKDAETKSKQAEEENSKHIHAVREKLDALDAKGNEKYEDFEEVLSGSNFPVEVLAEIADTENGEEVAYYLAHNPAEVDRLEKLSGRTLAKEMTRLGLGLETGKIVVKKTTTAPPPAKTVNGNANTRMADEKLSDDDWFARKRREKLSSA